MSKKKRSLLSIDPVYSLTPSRHYDGSAGEYKNVGHKKEMEIKNATVSLGFSLDSRRGDMAIISKDLTGVNNGGEFTVWVRDGKLIVDFQGATASKYLVVPDLILETHTNYHLAVSFGRDGLQVFLDGQIAAAAPDITEGLEANKNPLVIGGSRNWASAKTDDAHSLFKGEISNVMLFDKQLDTDDVLTLAQDYDPNLGQMAAMHADMSDLAPILQQLHGASDELLDILTDYGATHHGHFMRPLNMMTFKRGDDAISGTDADDGVNGGMGDDNIKALDGDDVVQGGYGNDKLDGGKGNDIIDGGHGEDKMIGGRGNDLLISRADGREPYVTYDPNRDEGDPDGDLTNGKLYPKQPLPADDVLIGGKGADIFYFQTLINAKERFIKKHTRDDGTINWHGVAGENDDIHDHWVDELGNDVVMDFSKAEGDRILIEGHTTQIAEVTYGDANKDGVVDHSIISLYSDQGNGGGAHNDDLLGTVTVYGDLVMESDIEQTAAPAYGIVYSIDDLDEAITPADMGTDSGRIKAPKGNLPKSKSMDLPSDKALAFAVPGTYDFDADDQDYMAFDAGRNTNLKAVTIAFSFVADSIGDMQGLFTKDAMDFGKGGHTAMYINELGDLKVRLQDDQTSYHFDIDFAIEAGKSYDVALNFGPKGAELYMNGVRVAYDKSLNVDWTQNDEVFVVGASGWANTSGEVDNLRDFFTGSISDVVVFDKQMTSKQAFGDIATPESVAFGKRAEAYKFSQDKDGTLQVKGGGNAVAVDPDTDFMIFKNITVRPMDVFFGGRGADTIHGSHSSDIIEGRNGNDKLIGYGNDDLLRGGQGDDELHGGKGADILFGDAGTDKLFGGDQNDFLYGGDDTDYLYGDAGNDTFYGGLGDDFIWGETWNDAGKAGKDKAVFDGNFADYTFSTSTWFSSSRGKDVTQLIVTDHASGGLDGFYEGVDKLVDIDFLVFSDQTVAFADLI